MPYIFARNLIVGLLIGPLALHHQAQAVIMSKPILISARYEAGCTIDMTSLLIDFGTLTPGSTYDYYATTFLYLRCDSGQTFGISAPFAGTNTVAGSTQRRLYNSTANSYLNYELSMYEAPLSGVEVKTGYTVTNGNIQSLTVSAKLPGGQNYLPGPYIDDLIFIVSW